MLESLIELFSKTNIPSGVIGGSLALLSALLIALFKSKVFQELLTGIFNWNFSMKGKIFKPKETKKTKLDEEVMEESLSEDDLLNHDIFNYIDFWLTNQIPSMTLKSRYRTAVFRKYLKIYFKTYKYKLHEYVKSREYEKYTSVELRKSIFDLFLNITKAMENDMMSNDIPNVIITKMKHAHRSRNELALESTISVCDRNIYDTKLNRMKVYSILGLIYPILDNTITNIEPVCDNLNGELGGLSIDGFTEPISRHNHEDIDGTEL